MSEEDSIGTVPAQVGIVIPCYNDDPGHLRESVESAITQDIEVRVVVVDDGSTNSATRDALSALPGIVEVIRCENGGPSAARNTGIEALTTPYVLPLDADDWVSPGFARAASALLRNGARIAGSDISHFGDGGWFEKIPDTVTLVDMVDTNRLGSASMFRRSDWERVGGYDASLRIGSEDYEFWVRLLALGGEARRVRGELFHHRLRSGSRSDQQRARFIEARRVTRDAMARNTPAIAGPALHRVDELLRENAALRSDNRWWWKRFGWVRRTARNVRSVQRRR